MEEMQTSSWKEEERDFGRGNRGNGAMGQWGNGGLLDGKVEVGDSISLGPSAPLCCEVCRRVLCFSASLRLCVSASLRLCVSASLRLCVLGD